MARPPSSERYPEAAAALRDLKRAQDRAVMAVAEREAAAIRALRSGVGVREVAAALGQSKSVVAKRFAGWARNLAPR